MNKFIFLMLSFLLSVTVFTAQDGAYDTSFGDDGIVITDLGGIDSGPFHVVQQADGKLVVTAYRWEETEEYTLFLLRYLSDGSLDLSYGNDGKVVINTTVGVLKPFIQDNDKILIAGQYNDSYLVQRYTNSGNLDTSFADNGTLTHSNSGGNYQLQMLPDDSFIIVKEFQSNGTVNTITLQKYLPDGNIDTLFGTNGVSEAEIPIAQGNSKLMEFKIQNDGSILVLGARRFIDLTEQLIFIKFLSDGTLDNSLGTNGVSYYDMFTPTSGTVFAKFDIAGNGNIIVAGSIGNCQYGISPFLKRFLPNGQIDVTFGSSGSANIPNNWSHPNSFQVTIQENNRILIGWNKNMCVPEGFAFSILRVFEDGFVDSSFSLEENTIGLQPNSSSSFIIQDDGKIVTTARTGVPLVNNNGDIYLGRHVNDPLSIAEASTALITVFPNPSSGIFNLRSQQPISGAYTISDINGRTILNGNLNGIENQVDISVFSEGVYFLKVFGTTIKLLKK